jgi:hypothetical protein
MRFHTCQERTLRHGSTDELFLCNHQPLPLL